MLSLLKYQSAHPAQKKVSASNPSFVSLTRNNNIKDFVKCFSQNFISKVALKCFKHSDYFSLKQKYKFYVKSCFTIVMISGPNKDSASVLVLRIQLTRSTPATSSSAFLAAPAPTPTPAPTAPSDAFVSSSEASEEREEGGIGLGIRIGFRVRMSLRSCLNSHQKDQEQERKVSHLFATSKVSKKSSE